MDFIEELPKSKGKDTIMVVVNYFTKYAHFIGLSHPFLALQVTVIFIEVRKLHGLPMVIVIEMPYF